MFFPKYAEGGLGSLSARYESGGNLGAIANNKGDIGGKSYGSYQLTVNSGNAQKFADWYGGALKGKKAGTPAFDKAWKVEVAKNPEKFAKAQHDFIAKTHYYPAVDKVKNATGLDVTRYPKAVQDVLWSTAVQHGVDGAVKVFKNAGIKPGMNAKEIINRVYNERSKIDKYFASSSSNVKQSVKKRFEQEKMDALRMLG